MQEARYVRCDKLNYKHILSLGWDVGGWMGNKHGFALVRWTKGNNELEWLGNPIATRIPQDCLFNPKRIISQFLCIEEDTIFEDTKVVIAIDAPLGLPIDYMKMIKGQAIEANRPKREIDSRLAYRDTEREIYQVFGKKPLSATFDRLGNNCSVAISHISEWCKKYGYSVHPMTYGSNDGKVIIEVYPAIAKSETLRAMIPKNLSSKTDEYDAAICAIMGVSYGANGEFKKLPKLVEPPENIVSPKTEGWIYYMPVE